MRCASDKAFLQFYDQLHNFIHITAGDERDPARKGRIEHVRKALEKLMDLLDRKGWLAGLQKARIGEEISSRNVESSLNTEAED